jgi:hypothetical protein
VETIKLTILAIDIGTTMGWAQSSKNGSIKYGTESYQGTRFDSAGMRYVRFNRWLEQFAIGADMSKHLCYFKHDSACWLVF